MTKYRFKTEQEFIDEFGTNWKSRIYGCWNHIENIGMNYLFGSELPIESYNNFPTDWFEKNKNDFFRLQIPRRGFEQDCIWSITIDMIKEINNLPNYNDKKILVYD